MEVVPSDIKAVIKNFDEIFAKIKDDKIVFSEGDKATSYKLSDISQNFRKEYVDKMLTESDKKHNELIKTFMTDFVPMFNGQIRPQLELIDEYVNNLYLKQLKYGVNISEFPEYSQVNKAIGDTSNLLNEYLARLNAFNLTNGQMAPFLGVSEAQTHGRAEASMGVKRNPWQPRHRGGAIDQGKIDNKFPNKEYTFVEIQTIIKNLIIEELKILSITDVNDVLADKISIIITDIIKRLTDDKDKITTQEFNTSALELIKFVLNTTRDKKKFVVKKDEISDSLIKFVKTNYKILKSYWTINDWSNDDEIFEVIFEGHITPMIQNLVKESGKFDDNLKVKIDFNLMYLNAILGLKGLTAISRAPRIPEGMEAGIAGHYSNGQLNSLLYPGASEDLFGAKGEQSDQLYSFGGRKKVRARTRGKKRTIGKKRLVKRRK